ncbi:hypothetical protein [Rhodopseudomonas sp. B29]|uniref:hypothetical protein n=1 Tax=Rhodopseudomonas sp. B29 TaxID=95607 RepID=UPI000347AD1F|nr:hypothetical protein [Rhodopseudomonas sp. B29]
MALVTSTSNLDSDISPATAAGSGIAAEIRDFWRQFFVQAFSPYRPELHYMRGPGPAWRAKHGDITRAD